MIREYDKNDIDVIIHLLNLHSELSEGEEKEKRKELEDDAKVLVFEEICKVQGMCYLTFLQNQELGSRAEIIMSIEKDCEFEKVANELWEAIQKPLKEKEVNFLYTYYSEEDTRWKEFYSQKHFEHWFGIYNMVYKGGKCSETDLAFRNYEEGDFNKYYTYIGECFSPMREANDIKPYNLYKGSSPERIETLKKGTLESKDSIYLFYDGEKLVGSSVIKQEEIDDLFVVPEYQGKGYGRKIMEASINLALEKNPSKITLGVVAWNKVAYSLYKSLRFVKYQGYEFIRLISN